MPIAIPFSFLCAFLSVAFMLQWWQCPAYPGPIWGMLISGILLGMCICTVRHFRHAGIMLIAGMLGMSIAFLSVARHSTALSAQTLPQYATGAILDIHGTVIGQPDDRLTFVRYTVDVEAVTISGAIIPVHGYTLVTDRSMIERALPGDRLNVSGKLEIPADNADFSYKNYLAMDGITTIMNKKTLQVESSDTWHLQAALWKIRRAFEERIGSVFPEPGASLLAGLLTGSQRGLPERIADDFRRTGISHIIAISGSNITIILSVMGGALFFLPLRWKFLPSVIGIALFTLLVGAEASVVRAAIMGILGLVALQAGRLTHTRLLILWTMFFMLVWNPAQLWTDMGFQLSFLAVIGLAELQHLIEPLVKHLPKTAGIREAMLATLAAQLTTTPWSAAQFGQLSLISPLANLLVAPLVPIAMLFGFIGTLAEWISPILGQILGIPAKFALDLILLSASTLAALPYASVTLPAGTEHLSLLCYPIIFLLLMRIRRRTARLPVIHKH